MKDDRWRTRLVAGARGMWSVLLTAVVLVAAMSVFAASRESRSEAAASPPNSADLAIRRDQLETLVETWALQDPRPLPSVDALVNAGILGAKAAGGAQGCRWALAATSAGTRALPPRCR